jgi:hypothetical protein
MLEAAKTDPAHAQLPSVGMDDLLLAKKPHGKEWVSDSVTTGREYQRIITPICPSGDSGRIYQMDPSDPSNGVRRE